MSGSQKTQINPMGAATSINPSVKAEYNSSRETELNTAVLGQDTAIPAGTLLAGQYRVEISCPRVPGKLSFTFAKRAEKNMLPRYIGGKMQ